MPLQEKRIINNRDKMAVNGPCRSEMKAKSTVNDRSRQSFKTWLGFDPSVGNKSKTSFKEDIEWLI